MRKKNKISFIPPIIENGKVISEPDKKSEIFNKLFWLKMQCASLALALHWHCTGRYWQTCTRFTPKEEFWKACPTLTLEVAKLCREIKTSNGFHCGIPRNILTLRWRRGSFGGSKSRYYFWGLETKFEIVFHFLSPLSLGVVSKSAWLALEVPNWPCWEGRTNVGKIKSPPFSQFSLFLWIFGGVLDLGNLCQGTKTEVKRPEGLQLEVGAPKLY